MKPVLLIHIETNIIESYENLSEYKKELFDKKTKNKYLNLTQKEKYYEYRPTY